MIPVLGADGLHDVEEGREGRIRVGIVHWDVLNVQVKEKIIAATPVDKDLDKRNGLNNGLREQIVDLGKVVDDVVPSKIPK